MRPTRCSGRRNGEEAVRRTALSHLDSSMVFSVAPGDLHGVEDVVMERRLSLGPDVTGGDNWMSYYGLN